MQYREKKERKRKEENKDSQVQAVQASSIQRQSDRATDWQQIERGQT